MEPLGRLSERLGQLLERLGRLLERLGLSWASLEPNLEALGRLLQRLGRLLALRTGFPAQLGLHLALQAGFLERSCPIRTSIVL